MTTEAQTTETTQQTQQTQEVTLDDVYKESGLDKVTTQQTQQPPKQETQQTQQTETKVEPSSVPDPYDAENFKAYMARQAAGTTALNQAVGEIAKFLSAQQQKEAVSATKADIEKAVSTINEVVGHPKSKVIEATLDGMVRENPQLKAIWDNRGKNPAAWNKALGIVTKQIADDFSVKVDPNLVNAQRARKEAQRQMATTTQESNASPVEERLAAAQGGDFDLEWQKLVSGGN